MFKRFAIFIIMFPFAVTAIAQPDLAIIGNVTVTAPSPVHVGISVTISFNVQNIGNANAGITQTAILISSPNNSIPATVIRKVSLEALAPGATSSNIQVVFLVPYQITVSGNYNIIVNLNYDETIPETNHLNNIAGTTIGVDHNAWAAQNIPYPIIFIHGLVGANTTWNELITSLQNTYGWSYGGNMNFCLNYDQNLSTANKANDYHDFTNVSALRPDDYFTVNFDVNYDGVPYTNSDSNQSNQSAIVKQGLAIRDAIKHVLEITGRDKVILVGHSMGGLAAREYLQNPSIWHVPNVNHHVAKLLTIGTPHGGSNATDFHVGFFEGDLSSEAVRDLRTSYLISNQPGAYLFNGAEDLDYLNDLPGNGYDFYNVDVNCNGNEGDYIIGINEKQLPVDISYSCIIGVGDALGGDGIPFTNGDGIVKESSANINNYRPVAAEIFTISKPDPSIFEPTWHTELTKQFPDIMQGLDEANNNVDSHAYRILSGELYYGNITYQSSNSPVRDYDNYRINIPSTGNLNIQVYNIPTPVYSIEIRNVSNNSIYSIASNGKSYINTNISLNAGNYYIVLSGIPTATSYKYPYAFKCTFSQSSTLCNSVTILSAASGTFNDGSGNNNYNNNSDCKWKIQPSGATSISLTFSDFDIDSLGDTLYIYDGGTELSPLLAAVTGNAIPSSVSSTRGVVLVRFKTDGSNTAPGWSANYTSIIVPTFCNGTTSLTAPAGNISDGSGVADYAKNSFCSWLINPTDAFSVTLTFNQFNTEPTNDIVNIYDGNDNTGALLGSYSGASIPPSITSTGGAIFIEFITNDTINGPGWAASYTSYIPFTSTGINKYQYWFDEAYHNALEVDIFPQRNFQLRNNIPTFGLSVGLHKFNIRFKDSKNQWSSIISSFFIKNPTGQSPAVESYQYWVDNNFSGAVTTDIPPQSVLELDTSISFGYLPQGLHSFHLRFKDTRGVWSSVVSSFFIKRPVITSNKLIRWRYWVDNNLAGQRLMTIQHPQNFIDLIDSLDLSFLNTGKHYLHLQFKDSLFQWSSVVSDSFFVYRPAIPPPPLKSGAGCLITLKRQLNPPAGILWYWQGLSCDTSLSLGADSVFYANNTGDYYLRAYEISTGIWSSDCSSVNVSITPSDIIVWTGNQSSDWSNGLNWSCGYVPDHTKDIIIPPSTPFSPKIPNGSSYSCKSIKVLSGALLTVGENASLNVMQ